MSAGKGSKARNNLSEEYRTHYDEIFRKSKLSPIKIFFDLDECILHSMWGKSEIKESIGGIDDFVFNIGYEQYRTVIRPGARECIAYAREQVGADNVYVLTASVKEYANLINTTAELGFKTEQIFHRADIREVVAKRQGSPEFRPCIIIDNLSYNDNMEKCYFLRIDYTDYQRVQNFYNDRTTDLDFITTVKAFIDRRIKHYADPTNR